MKTVAVLSDEMKFLEYVAPAVARYALKHGHAQVYVQEPFTIKLNAGVSSCPRPLDNDIKLSPLQGERMSQKQVQSIKNFNEFFKNVSTAGGGDEEVWVKSISPKGRQVILEIKSSQGDPISIPPIKTGTPVCLTDEASFEELKASVNLRNAVTKGLIRLMTTEEADAYIEKKAKFLNTDPSKLKEEQAKEKDMFFGQRPRPDSSLKIGEIRTERVENIINAKVEALCNLVAAHLPEDKREPVTKIMPALYDMEESLTADDLSYIQSRGYYKSVKDWATQILSERFSEGAQQSDE